MSRRGIIRAAVGLAAVKHASFSWMADTVDTSSGSLWVARRPVENTGRDRLYFGGNKIGPAVSVDRCDERIVGKDGGDGQGEGEDTGPHDNKQNMGEYSTET